MRYVQLRAFHNVALFGGFSRAASALHLTQPAISDQVRKLEQEHDVLLFNRAKKQISLTEQGKKLFEITKRMFEIEQQASELLSQTRALNAGTLRIIVDSAFHIMALLNLFREKYPAIKIEMRSGNSRDVIEALNSYGADIGVLATQSLQDSLVTVPLGSTQIVAFASRKNPLVNVDKISLKQLAQLPLVLREEGSRTRQKLEACFAGAGIPLVPAIVADSREAVREIVATGEAIGFVSHAEFGEDGRLFSMAITGPKKYLTGLSMNEAIACLRDRKESRLIRTFMNLAEANPY
ncbi:MAG: LysR substrate-binding domain-containing protein [Rhizobiaceae bacterium]